MKNITYSKQNAVENDYFNIFINFILYIKFEGAISDKICRGD